MTEGMLVRSLRDFSSSVQGELSLAIGSILQIDRKVDRYWLYGGGTDGRFGAFPASHVVDVQLPPFDEDGREQIYVSKANFRGQEAGDLPFRKGDLIVGEAAVDVNWHRGRCNGLSGIFPLNLVWPANMKLILKNKVANDTFVNLRAKVKMDLKAQLEEEIDLHEGDVVTITEVVDKDWYRGVCMGKTGIFPSSFVILLDDDETDKNLPDLLSFVADTNDNLVKSFLMTTTEPFDGYRLQFGGDKLDVIAHPQAAYAKTIYQFRGEYPNELSFEAGVLVNLLRRVDSHWLEGELDGRVGLFPLCYVQVIVDLPSEEEEDARDGREAATILYDFRAQLDGDVGVSEGEKVSVLRRLDSGWSQVRTSRGDVGLCPSSYIQSLTGGKTNRSTLPSSIDGAWHRQASLPTWPRSVHVVPPPSKVEFNGDTQFATIKPDEMRSRSMPPPRPPPIRHPILQDFKVAIDDASLSLMSTTTMTEASLRIPHRPAPPVPLQRRRPHSVAAICVPSSLRRQQQQQQQSRPVSQNMSDLDNSSEGEAWVDAPSTFSEEGGVLLRQKSGNRSTTATERSSSTSPSTVTTTIEDRAEKHVRKRRLILAELLQTERTYLQDLQFCRKTFLSDPQEANSVGVDVQLLFGSVDRLLALSQKLLGHLEQSGATAAPGETSMENPTIGFCFKQVASEMKEVYSSYCTRHEEVLALLDKYEENPEIARYFREKLETGPSSSHYFNMGSVLIKPVQRIMKYPLLLNELVKVTDDDDAARKDLVAAIELMTDVASAINECKRKKDLVMKYRKESDEGQTAKLAKLNLHSVVKKSQRIGMRLSSSLGLVSLTKDMAFDDEENKFRVVERTTRVFSRNCEAFCTNLQECVTHQFKLAEHIGDLYAERRNQADVDQFRTVQRTIISTIWADFKAAVEARVTDPLSELVRTFDGPNRLIEKRNDKLLDYDRASAKIEKNKDINRSGLLREELQLAKNTYEALNSQLLEELPKLMMLSGLVLKDCISAFVFARKRFVGRVTQITLPLVELPQFSSCAGDILDVFEEKHAEVIETMSKISLIPREFHQSPHPERSSGRFGTIERLKKSAALKSTATTNTAAATGKQAASERAPEQSSSQKAYLQGRYLPETLYVTVQSYCPLDAMELSLNAGDVVAVVKSQDPMGCTNRWFVDDGVRKGFVPAKFLASTLPTTILSPSPPPPPPPPPPPYVGRSPSMSVNADEAATMTQDCQQSCHIRYDLVCEDDAFDGNISTRRNISEIEGRYDRPCEIADIQSDGTVSPDNVSLYENLEPMTSQYSVQSTSPGPSEYFYATYEFQSTGPNELSLVKGQVVLVRHRHDLDGNPDWWFVEDRYGNQGYAPCNYLSEYNASNTCSGN